MKRTILIADDDKTVSGMLKDFLSQHGFAVHAVEDGLQALHQAHALRPDLIILDFEIPAASGAVVYARLKNSTITDSIPIIFLTGKMSALLQSRVPQSPAVKFLAKPVDLKSLHGSVLEMLGSDASRAQTVPMPVAPPMPMRAAPRGVEAPRTVLVVDDEASVIKMLRDVLEPAGYKVREARDGRQARTRLEEGDVDLVLLDLALGGESGIDVCRSLRRQLGDRYVPIVILTAHAGTENLVLGLEAGADDFLAKLCQIPELLSRIRSMIRLKDSMEHWRKLNAFKDELLAIASHDLLGPLTVVLGCAEVLLSSSTVSDDKRRQFLSQIVRAGNMMHGLVKRFLHRAQLESDDLPCRFEDLDPTRIVGEAVERLSILATRKGVRLECESSLSPGYRLRADPGFLDQITANLVGNAIKFTPEKGRIHVGLRSAKGFFILTVSDTGPGIAPQDQATIFEKFRRGASVKVEGVGYGLAIVKKFSELHGGRVELQSTPGEGTSFSVHIPESGNP